MSTVLENGPQPAATVPDGVHPLRGNAVLARYGDLTLVCEAVPGRQHRIGALLDAVAEVAAGEAGGRRLSHQVAGLVSSAGPDEDFPALCAFGPTRDGMAVVVHGGAELIVTVNGEQVHLDGRDAVTVLDRVITDPVEAVQAVVGGTDLGPVEEAPSVPREAPGEATPEPADGAIPTGETTAEETATRVPGVQCARNHFNDPAVSYCSVCGISMAQSRRAPDWGPRPQLGVLVLDDGTTVPLLRDLVIGRMPEADDAVAAGEAEPVTLADPLVSRRHARIALREWQVVVTDLGSANGTFVLARDSATWTRLEPGAETVLEPGSTVAAGMRQFHYYSHRHR
ncbi:FHA domain-containing protein [Amycolatopsis balhimycina]|nr:FHA domain-containing protein [Amycolatopsis balhimycina]